MFDSTDDGIYIYLSTSVSSPFFWHKSDPIFVLSTCCLPTVLAEGCDTSDPQIAQLQIALRFHSHWHFLYCVAKFIINNQIVHLSVPVCAEKDSKGT